METTILQCCHCTLLLLLCIGSSCGSSCGSCFDPYTAAVPSERNCTFLQNVLTCHSHADDCPLFISVYVRMIENELETKNCSVATTAPVATTTPTPPPTTLPPEACPTLSPQLEPTIETADVQRAVGVPEQCRRTSSTAVQCSMFMNSHLRPFHFLDQTDNIETCSVAGTWELFSHEDLTILVEGRTEEEGSQHTRLTMVKITFSPHEGCNEEAMSYVAHNNRSLPSNFVDGCGASISATSALQLHLSENGSVVTLIAAWLDATVIIRRLGDYLAVTLRVSGHMAFESQGLCTARCPGTYRVDSMSYLQSMLSSCPEPRNAAFLSCIVPLNQVFVDVVELSYVEACLYSMLRGESPYDLIMSQALVADSRLLPPIGIVPIPNNSSLVSPTPLLQTTPPQTTPICTSTTQSTKTQSPTHQTSSATPPSKVLFETFSHARALSGHMVVVMATSLYLLYSFM